MIIMKFGGTSVGNAERIAGVAALVKSRIKEKPIVVVSAVGGVTDLLLETGQRAAEGVSANGSLQKLQKLHETIIRELGVDGNFLGNFLDDLSKLCGSIATAKEFPPKLRDHLTSFGERISVRILALCLEKKGTKAKAFDAWDAGFLTTSDFGQAKLLPQSAQGLQEILGSETAIPVITGFIGKDVDGNITTLGRGGSDLSASLIGAALDVKQIEIWTDVPGIMTADPRLVPKAHPIPSVTFQEAAELSAFGAKVLHPKTIEPAMQKNIPVLVKNTFKPSDPGTAIVPVREKREGLTAITLKSGVTSLNIYSTGMLETHGFLAGVFGILDRSRISVDVVATSEVNVSLTLDNTEGLDQATAQLEEFAEVSVRKDRAILCLVGEGLRDTPGIAGQAFQVMGKSGINIEMISQGASQINLTFVVESRHGEKALRLLHREFFES